jgi:hypothetical protein
MKILLINYHHLIHYLHHYQIPNFNYHFKIRLIFYIPPQLSFPTKVLLLSQTTKKIIFQILVFLHHL